MKKSSILAVALSATIVASAQTVISDYTPGISTEGATYYLPKTAININITVEKSVYTPGELCQYADRYLRISGTSDKEDIHYSIKNVTLETEGIPDESKLYHIKFTTNSVAPLIDLDDSGILLAVNTDNPYTNHPETAAKPAVKPLNPRAYMTEEMLMTGSKAKMAELVAKEIYNIRESRNLLLRGQSENIPKDGEGLQIILNNIKEQEEALMQLFTGTTTIEESTHTFQIFPESEAERLIFGRFSRKLGLLHQDDLGGTPLYIDIKSRNSVPTASVEKGEASKKDAAKPKKSKSAKQDGLVYNIPGKADVKIYTNTVTLADDVLSLTQFGNKETLSSSLFSKRKDIKVILDPKDGSIKKIEE